MATADEGGLSFHPLENELLVEVSGSLARMVDGRLVVDAKLSRGLPKQSEGGLVDVVGWWPDRVVAVMSTMGTARLTTLRNGAWKPASRNPHWPGYDYWGGSVVGQDSIMGLFFSYEPRGGPALRFARLLGSGPLPEFAMPPGNKCAAYVTPLGFRAFETGHVVVAGPRCGDGKPALTMWSPAGGEGSTQVWEDLSDRVQSRAVIVGRSADDFFVAWQMRNPAGTRIAHFDGKVLQPIEAPAGVTVEGFAMDQHGSLWLASLEGLFCKRSTDNGFARVNLLGRRSKAQYVTWVGAIGDNVWAATPEEVFGSQPPPDGVQSL